MTRKPKPASAIAAQDAYDVGGAVIAAHDVYGVAMGGMLEDGRPYPKFSSRSTQEQEAWIAAIRVALDFMKDKKP